MTTSSQPRVMIFDTTLRDGEQSPGATMTHDEKLEIAGLLDEMGVDVIEAGFPIASEGDFAAVAAIAKRAKNSTIANSLAVNSTTTPPREHARLAGSSSRSPTTSTAGRSTDPRRRSARR